MGRKPKGTAEERAARKREVMRAAQARFRERHREELARKRRERYWRDPEKARKQAKKWSRTDRERHGDVRRASNREYRAKNRDRLVQALREYRQRNLDRLREYDRIRSRERRAAGDHFMREWRRKNPDKVRVYLRASFHKRRAQSGDESFTSAEWRALLDRHGPCCGYCGQVAPLTADHRIPLSRGGSNLIENILPACKGCNSRKNSMSEAEFRAVLALESADVGKSRKQQP